MERFLFKIIQTVGIVLLCAAVLIGVFLLAQLRSRYTKEVAVPETDTVIEVCEKTDLRLYLNFHYHMRCLGFALENAAGGQVQAAFVGDSITELAQLGELYPQLRTVNRGIAGDTTRGILCRMQESVFDVDASVFVLLAGINDLMNEKRPPQAVAQSYREIVQGIRSARPKAQIVCQSVYPTSDAACNARVRALNAAIQDIAAQFGCVYVDVDSRLADERGVLFENCSEDGVHPNARGYAIIAAALCPVLETLVGI